MRKEKINKLIEAWKDDKEVLDKMYWHWESTHRRYIIWNFL